MSIILKLTQSLIDKYRKIMFEFYGLMNKVWFEFFY